MIKMEGRGSLFNPIFASYSLQSPPKYYFSYYLVFIIGCLLLLRWNSYLDASSVIHKTFDRLTTPIATLLNDLLKKDARMVAESSILAHSQKTMATPQPQNQLLTTNVCGPLSTNFTKLLPPFSPQSLEPWPTTLRTRNKNSVSW